MRHALSSASVRSIFSDLTSDGYIEQPHVSGGRVPRAQGYRYFVDQVLSGDSHEAAVPQNIIRLVEAQSDIFDETRMLQEEIAHHFRVLSQFGIAMPVGFDEVLGEPEFSEPALVKEFGRFLDEFNEYRNDYDELLDPESYCLFIGEENNIQHTDRMSVVVGKDANEKLFFIAGPTRMPYDRIIQLMKLWKKKPKKMTKK